MGEASNWLILLRTITALAAVIGLIYALSWAARKYLRPERWAGSSLSSIKVIQTFALDPKKRLMVVEIENQRLLLGLSENSISCLSKLGEAHSSISEVSREAVSL